MTSASVLAFTCAQFGARSLYRAVTLELTLERGEGRILVDVARGNGFDLAFQRHLANLHDVGRTHYALPWDTTDLRLACRGRGTVLDGASASLPIFVAWVALLADRSLPTPFLATGVATHGTDALEPAPHAFARGKTDVARAYATQAAAGSERPSFWLPRGSEIEGLASTALALREVGSLREAVLAILGLPARTAEGAS